MFLDSPRMCVHTRLVHVQMFTKTYAESPLSAATQSPELLENKSSKLINIRV